MSWTDERVETLKKLWMEGLSASQIAGELGLGVTRNAVIGKVHRLKLSTRAKPTNAPSRPRTTSRTVRRTPVSAGSSSSGGGMMKRRSMGSGGGMMGATALKHDEDTEIEHEVISAQVQELFIPEAERVSLLGLSEDTCKWPIGDPLTPDFYFCGQHSLDSKPYCEFHAKRAYHQMDRKRR